MQDNNTNKTQQTNKRPKQDNNLLNKTSQDNARQDKTIQYQNNNNAIQYKTPKQDNTITIICNTTQYWTQHEETKSRQVTNQDKTRQDKTRRYKPT